MFKKTFIAASLFMAFQSTAAEIQLHNGSIKAIIETEMQSKQSLGSEQQLFRLQNILNETKHQALFEQYLQGRSFYSPLFNTIIQFNDAPDAAAGLFDQLKVYQKFGDYCQDVEQVFEELEEPTAYQLILQRIASFDPLFDIEQARLQLYIHGLFRPYSFHQVDFNQSCKTYTAEQIESFKHPEKNNNYAPLLELYVNDIKARYPFLQRDNQILDLDKYLAAKTLTRADYLQTVQHILTELDDGHNYYRYCPVVDQECQDFQVLSSTKLDKALDDEMNIGWDKYIEALKALKTFKGSPIATDEAHGVLWTTFADTYVKNQLDLDHQDGQKMPKVGYLNLNRFATYRTEAGVASYETFQQEVINTMLKQMADQTDALIIDVRINRGGHGRNPIDLAEKFMDWGQRTPAERTNGVPLVKVVDKGASHLDVQPYLVKPATGSVRYSKPVILLTSPHTVSAADYFTVAMQELAQDVTLVGQKTPAYYSAIANITNVSAPNMDLAFISTQLAYLHGQTLERDEQGHLRGISPKPENIIEDMPYSTYYSEASPAFERAFEIIQTKLEAKNAAESNLD